MQIGYLLPTREAVMSGRYDVEPMLELAGRAEEAGFDSVWAGDSLIARPRFEPLTLLAAVAARTRRVRLGTAVLISVLRPPVVLAHIVATLDRVAGGRFILGVGLGQPDDRSRQEFEAAGAVFERRVGRLRQQIAICRSLWHGEQIDIDGEFWRMRDVQVLPTTVRPDGPPVWVGGSSPLALRLAGEIGDGWYPNAPTPAAYGDGWTQVAAHAAGAGRPASAVERALYTTVNVGPKPAAEAELKAFIEHYYGRPYDWISARQGCFAGEAAACLERLGGYAAHGVSHMVLRFGGADQAGQIDRAARDLLPRLKAMAS